MKIYVGERSWLAEIYIGRFQVQFGCALYEWLFGIEFGLQPKEIGFGIGPFYLWANLEP